MSVIIITLPPLCSSLHDPSNKGQKDTYPDTEHWYLIRISKTSEGNERFDTPLLSLGQFWFRLKSLKNHQMNRHESAISVSWMISLQDVVPDFSCHRVDTL